MKPVMYLGFVSLVNCVIEQSGNVCQIYLATVFLVYYVAAGVYYTLPGLNDHPPKVTCKVPVTKLIY